MSRYVKISSVSAGQADAVPGDYARTAQEIRRHLEHQLRAVLCDHPDLAVLPEICNCPRGYSLAGNADYFVQYNPACFEMVSALAAEYGSYILLPAYVLDNGRWYNRATLLDRQGNVCGHYDKAFPMVEEILQQNITPGSAEPPLLHTDFGTVACLICFDLNFDCLREYYARQKPDLAVFCSMFHGGPKQWQWAYALDCPLAGAVCGLPSQILLPTGEVAAQSTNYYPGVTATLNLDGAHLHLDGNLPKLERIKQKYGEQVRISDPGLLGSVYLSVETAQLCVQDLIREYELERVGDYFARARQFCDRVREEKNG